MAASAATEDFGNRPQKLIEAFRALDKDKSGKLPTPLMSKLLSQFAPDFIGDERQEFFTEADDKGFIQYESFVRNVIFGKIKL